MMRSMFAGVSGLRSHQVMMDVVGNNIANVNTVGFKSSRVIFQDTLSQMLRGSSGGTGEATAGVNPQQVGLGVRVGGIDIVFAQGASQLTGKATDVSIQGDGFFVERIGAETLYTRAGSFSFDPQGFLTDPSGGVVQGWLAATDGSIVTNAPISDLKLPVGQVIEPIPTKTVNLGGNVSADAPITDPPVQTAVEVIDSLGAKVRVSFDFVKTADNTWTLTAKDATGASIGTANLVFDPATGKLTTPATMPSFTFDPGDGSAPLTFTADMSNGALTQFGGPSTAAALGQDGSGSGYLRSFAISDDGIVSGVFSNGKSKTLAQLAVATFANPQGLVKAGGSMYRASSVSGTPLAGIGGTAGRGSLAAGTLEMSNVDLAQEFTNLIIAQRGFQANSRIITASDELLQDLVNLKR
jgi:flagellar hook protein FlgE